MLDLNAKIEFKLKTITKDADGFQSIVWENKGTARAAMEHKTGDLDGIESKNARRTGVVAVYATEKVYFTVRKNPNIEITNDLTIFHDSDKYDILEINNTKGRGMYTRILAERVEMTNGKI